MMLVRARDNNIKVLRTSGFVKKTFQPFNFRMLKEFVLIYIMKPDVRKILI